MTPAGAVAEILESVHPVDSATNNATKKVTNSRNLAVLLKLISRLANSLMSDSLDLHLIGCIFLNIHAVDGRLAIIFQRFSFDYTDCL